MKLMILKKSLLVALVSVALGSVCMGGEVELQNRNVFVKTQKVFAQFEQGEQAGNPIFINDNDNVADDASTSDYHLVDLRTPVSEYPYSGMYTVLENGENEKGVLVSDINYTAIAALPHETLENGVAFEISNECSFVVAIGSVPASNTEEIFEKVGDRLKGRGLFDLFLTGYHHPILKINTI